MIWRSRRKGRPKHLPLTPRRSAPPEPRYYSLIDLGADTIKVAVVGVQGDVVQVLGHSLATTQGRDIAGGRAEGAALAASVNRALQEAEDASEATLGHKTVPDETLFLLPGRTFIGQQFTVNHPRPHSGQTITHKELDNLWERADRLARAELLQLPTVGEDWVIQAVTQTGLKVNHRMTNDPQGLKGETLSLSVYAVACQPAIVRALEQLADRLEVDIHSLVAPPLSLPAILPSRDALIVDVGWSGTDFYLVRQRVPLAAGRSFLGGDFFTRSLATTFKYPPAEVESLKIAYASQTVLSTQDTALVQTGLTVPLSRWAELAGETIRGMLPTSAPLLPERVYFMGGSATLPGLHRHFLTGLDAQGLSFERTPEVQLLGQKSLPNYRYAPAGFRGILFAPVLSLAKTIGNEYGKNH